MKQSKECSGECVKCLYFYFRYNCGQDSDMFEQMSDKDINILADTKFSEEDYYKWEKEKKRKLKLQKINNLIIKELKL